MERLPMTDLVTVVYHSTNRDQLSRSGDQLTHIGVALHTKDTFAYLNIKRLPRRNTIMETHPALRDMLVSTELHQLL